MATVADSVRLAKMISIGLGAVATLSAGFASRLGSVLDASNILQGAFSGSMFACMFWAVSRLEVRPQALLAGMVLGAAVAWYVATTAVSSFWVAPAGFAVALAVPWCDRLASRQRAGTASR